MRGLDVRYRECSPDLRTRDVGIGRRYVDTSKGRSRQGIHRYSGIGGTDVERFDRSLDWEELWIGVHDSDIMRGATF